MTACAAKGEWQTATALLESCQQQYRIAPDMQTYEAALQACAKGGAAAAALELLNSIDEPSLTAYNIAMNACGR